MFAMIKTKACRRCGGNLAFECDKYGSYVACIQCGGVDKELSDQVSVQYGATFMERTRRGNTKVGAGYRYFDG